MPIRIVYDYQKFSEQRYGGISRYYFELASRVNLLDGFDVEIFCPLFINEYIKGKSVSVSGVYIPEIPKMTKFIGKINHALTRLSLFSKPPDIVHETYYSEKEIAPQSTAKIVTVHDMILEKYPKFFPNAEMDRLSVHKSKAIKRADKIICISENTKKDLIEFLDVDSHKIAVVYHGYPSINYPEDVARLILEPYILFVGSRSGYKNFGRCIEAYGRSSWIRNNFKLVCFGGGRFSSDELGKMHTLSIPDRSIVHFSGGDHVLTALYYHASALVYPSLYEGFGLPLLEAMSFKCPVVCSNTSSMPEVAGMAAEYFDPKSTDSIVSALESVLSSPDKSRLLTLNGLERVKHFSWEKCAEETSVIYQSVV